MKKVIKKRKSTRDFSNKKLNSNDLSMLKEKLESMPKLCSDDGLGYKLFEDGSNFANKLEGIAGYGGVMIKAPHYLVLVVKEGSENLKAAGYSAEWLALGIAEQEIGSCWISTNSNEDKISELLGVEAPYSVACILALGYPEKPSFLASIFGGSSQKRTAQQSVEYGSDEKVSSRMSTSDFVYMGTFGEEAEAEELEQRGYFEAFHYMKFAPSSLNRQPWRFVIGKEYILLAINADDGYEDNRLAYLEAGIAMLYFKVAMSSEGFGGVWVLDEDIDRLGTPGNFIIGGAYRANI